MSVHRIRAHQIALILAILAIICEISWANPRCKSVVMGVHITKCRTGNIRHPSKRSLERLDLQNYDEKLKHDEKLERQEEPDSLKMNAESHGIPQKRQLPPLPFSNIIPSIVENTASTIETHSLPGTSNAAPELNIQRIFKGPLSYSSAFNDDLSHDLSNEELEELYNNMYERIPRASKEEAWKVFLETASKCCQNVEKCLKDATYVPCLAD